MPANYYITSGLLGFRSDRDIWRHRKVFTSPSILQLIIHPRVEALSIKQFRRLTFPGVPPRPSGLKVLQCQGIPLAALVQALKLIQHLTTLNLYFVEPEDDPGTIFFRSSVKLIPEFGEWDADQDIITEALRPMHRSLTDLVFVHSNVGCHQWGRYFTKLKKLTISSPNLFPPGPNHWKHWDLFELIPKTLEKLEILDCDFSLEAEEDRGGPIKIQGKDTSQIVYTSRSLQRLATLLSNTEGHSLKQFIVFLSWNHPWRKVRANSLEEKRELLKKVQQKMAPHSKAMSNRNIFYQTILPD